MKARRLSVAAVLFLAQCSRPVTPTAQDAGPPSLPVPVAFAAPLDAGPPAPDPQPPADDAGGSAQVDAGRGQEDCALRESLEEEQACWRGWRVDALLSFGKAGLEQLCVDHGTEANLAFTYAPFEAACERGAEAGCMGALATISLTCPARGSSVFQWQLVRSAQPRTRTFFGKLARALCPATPTVQRCRALATAAEGCSGCFLACALRFEFPEGSSRAVSDDAAAPTGE